MLWMCALAVAQNPLNGDFEDGLEGWSQNNDARQHVSDFRMGAGSPSGEHVALFEIDGEEGRRELWLRSEPFTVRRTEINFSYLIPEATSATLAFQIGGADRVTLPHADHWTGTGFGVEELCGAQVAIELIHLQGISPGESRSYVDLVIESGDPCPGVVLDTGGEIVEADASVPIRGPATIVAADGCSCGQLGSAQRAWVLALALALLGRRRTPRGCSDRLAR